MNKVKSKLLGLIIASFSIFALTTLTHSNFVINDGNNKIQAQTFSSDNYKNKLQEFSYQNQQSWNNDVSLFSLKTQREYQHKRKRTKNGELYIKIDGWKGIVYRGGWFRQDKVEWWGTAELRFKKKSNRWEKSTYNPIDKLRLSVHSVIGGSFSPSFEYKGQTKYSGVFIEGATRKTNMSVSIHADTKEFVHSFEKKETDKVTIDYEGAGWNYRIFGFGQYATGYALDESESKTISSIDPSLPDVIEKLDDDNGITRPITVPIEIFNSNQKVYLDDKNSKFIKKI
ncbi:hypothetical protein [Mesomycoplasma ovipneumoniae]|uniref:hypothetical protein n=1 Tax=Mesomycoplasma ovipneumoniae TaxID=29562 RepID=UPI00311B2430